MPWGCWVELEDKDVHGKEWECMIENFTEEEADTTVHQIYGQRATLSVNYKPGDWDSVRAWILKAGSGWQQAKTAPIFVQKLTLMRASTSAVSTLIMFSVFCSR